MDYRTPIKNLTPPLLLNAARNYFHGYRGKYASWAEAQSSSQNYANPLILERVVQATRYAREHQCLERDSAVFCDPTNLPFSWPLLALLLKIHAEEGVLNVLDVGGALGASEWQFARFVGPLDYAWAIVEQPHFVDIGNQAFSSDKLKFFRTIQDTLSYLAPNTLLLSSVLQYIPSPAGLISAAFSAGVRHIIIDRQPIGSDNTYITVQRVPDSLYPVSYPAVIYSKPDFLSLFPDTTVEFEFASLVDPQSPIQHLGFYLRRSA